MAADSKHQSKKKKISFSEWVDGSFLLKEYIRKQYKLMLLVVLLIVMYISNNYSVIIQLAEIDSLKQKLTDIRYETLFYTSELMQESRQSHIIHLVEEKGLDLKETTIPPYKLIVHE